MNTMKKKELTADDVWAMFAASDAKLEKMFVETNEKMNKLYAETNEQMRRTDEKLNKLCGKVGGMDENLGFHAEQYFQDTLAETLIFGGEKYDKIYHNVLCGGKKNGMEFDIVLVNGKNVAIIEIKNRIHPNFVKELAGERIKKFREHFPEYKNHKAYLSIAGFSFSKKVAVEAERYGIGIIKQDGKSIEVKADKLKAY